MIDSFGWFSSVISDGILGISGGNIMLVILFALIGLVYIMTTLEISLPFAALISFFVLGVLSTMIDNPLDPILGSGNNGFAKLLFLILVAMGGVLLWHLFFKKSQAGVG